MALRCLTKVSAASTSHAKHPYQPRAYRTVPLKFLTVSRGASKAAAAFADEWLDKIVRFNTTTSAGTIKPNPTKAASPDVAKEKEGERLLELVQRADYLVVLDERGRSISSTGFADLLAQVGDDNVPALVFAVGGPYGHSEAVRQRSNRMIKLSDCVLNHSVAQVVLLEQVYRGYTLLRGEPYHH